MVSRFIQSTHVFVTLLLISNREIFQSIEKFCKTHIAYGEYTDVNHPNAQPKNSMESFFLAETLKYLYLLYDDDSEIDILNKVRTTSLDEYVVFLLLYAH